MIAQADTIATRLTVKQMFIDQHESCETYYSMYPEGIICNHDRKFKRMYEVQYWYNGNNAKIVMEYIPKEHFRVTDIGDIVRHDDQYIQDDLPPARPQYYQQQQYVQPTQTQSAMQIGIVSDGRHTGVGFGYQQSTQTQGYQQVQPVYQQQPQYQPQQYQQQYSQPQYQQQQYQQPVNSTSTSVDIGIVVPVGYKHHHH